MLLKNSLTTLLGLLLVAVPSKAADLRSFDELVGLVVEHRARISNGLFKIENRVSFGDSREARSEVIEVYLDAPTRLRATSLREFGEVGPRGEEPVSPFYHSVTRVEDAVYEYTSVDFGNTSGNLKKCAEVFDLRERERYEGLLTDPRMVGLAPRSYRELLQLTLATVMYYGKFDVRYVGTTRRHQGQECIELISVRGPRTHPELKETILVAPALDYNVLHIDVVGDGVDSVLDVELKEVADYGWFPGGVTLTRMRDGKLEKQSETSISIVDINRGVDDQVFNLSGMGVPLGAVVYDHRGGKVEEMQLTERGLVPPHPMIARIDLSQVDERSTQSMRRWILLLTALLVAAIGFALMLRALRKLPHPQ